MKMLKESKSEKSQPKLELKVVKGKREGPARRRKQLKHLLK